MACDRCDESRSAGNRFCPNCGKALRERITLRLALGAAMCLLCTYIIAYELIVVGVLFPETLEALANARTYIFIIVPMIVNIFPIGGFALQTYFVLLVAACFISAFLLFRDVPENIGKAIRKREYLPFQESALFRMSTLFAALMTFQMSIISLVLLMGQDLQSVDMEGYPVWAVLFSLVEASVWEEVLCRFLMLGVPVAIVAYMSGKEDRSWKLALGGFGIDRTALVFILFSSFIFGAGHLTNWGLWKFLPTFAFGLGCGYLFSKYGLHASIMLHFTVNLMSAGTWLSGSEINSVSMMMFPALALGLYFLISYVLRGYRFLLDMFARDQSI